MRRLHRLALGGVVVLAVLGTSDGAGPAWGAVGRSAVAESTFPVTAPSAGTDECVLPAHDSRPPAPPTPTGGGSTAVEPGPTGAGDLTVGIPPVVFIRPSGRRLVVTTNTGEPPQPRDSFYYVNEGIAGPAGAGMRHHVLSRCTKSHWQRGR